MSRLAARLPGLRPADAAAVPTAALAGIVFLVLAAKDGGFDVTIWLPAAIFVALMTVLALWFQPVRLARSQGVALAALAALTVWTACSIAWADVRGDAWIGADRTVFYLCLFALFLVLPWRPQTALLAVSLFSIGVAAVTLWQFLRVARSPVALEGYFVAGRLATPISYSNADCALLLMAALPALVFAARREVPLLLRGVLLATAGVTTELAIASQSRMSLIALPLVAVSLFAIVGWRVRLVVFAAPLAVAVGLSTPTILRLYDATLAGPGGGALSDARGVLLASAAALLVAGWLLAALDAKLEPSARQRRLAALAVALLTLVGAIAVVALAFKVAPHPLRTVQSQWRSFVHGDGYSDQRQSHLISSGTNRYDIWRVGVDEFRSAPILGVGADNFAVDYLRTRRSNSENPLYPHSLLLRVPAQTGVVGTLAFLVFLGAAAAALRPRLRQNDFVAAAVVASLLPFAYFFVHGLVDWFWEIPALGAPALAFLAMAVRLAVPDPAAPSRSLVPRPGIAVAGLVALAAFGLPWIAARETAVASRDWVGNRQLAYDRLSLAGRLNPLSDLPSQAEGLIAARSGDLTRARVAFQEAIGRNSVSWYSHLELAVVEAETGHRARARDELATARSLDPKELVLSLASQRFRRGRPLTQAAVDGLLAAQDRATRGAR